MCRSIAVKPSTRKSITAVTASKNPVALSCSQVIPILTQRPSGIFGSVNQLSNARPPAASRMRQSAQHSVWRAKGKGPARVLRLEAEALLDRGKSGPTVEGRHPVEPCRKLRRVGLQPLLGCLWSLFAVGENLVHHQVLDIYGVDEILDQSRRVRALVGPAGALIGVNNGAAEIRPEAVIAAGQVLDLEIDVHRVGRPAEEDDVFLMARG